MKKIFILLFVCLANTAWAQNYSREFGKYTSDEFKMTKYAKDTAAEAVVIYDIGKSFFQSSSTNEGLDIVFERRIKYKILKQGGLKWAQFEIPFYIGDQKMEEVYMIEGNTYNYENSQIRKASLDTKKVYEEKLNNHWMLKKFAMPDVKVGSIVEIQYALTSPFVFEFRGWDFQQKIPVIYSEYVTKMVPFYNYTYILQGTTKFDSLSNQKGMTTNRFHSVEYQDMVYTFAMKDLPAFRDEEFITSPEDYMIKLKFQLAEIFNLNGSKEEVMTTWPKMIKDLISHEYFGRYQKASVRNAGSILAGMNLNDTSALGKVKIIERYVKSNFNWNGEARFLADQSVKDFLKTKKGNSAEINLFLAGMLNSAGVTLNKGKAL